MGRGDQLIGGIPGKAFAISDSADGLRSCASYFRSISDFITGCKADGWTGEGADAYDVRVDEYQALLTELADRCISAAAPLDSFATTVLVAEAAAFALRAEVNSLDFAQKLNPIEALDQRIEQEIQECVQKYAKILKNVETAGDTAASTITALVNDQDPTDFDGDSTPLTPEQIAQIQQDIEDLKSGNWTNSSQGRIGDCYLLSSLGALLNTKEGQAWLASCIRWDEEAGAFMVTLYTDDGPVEVPVAATYDQGITYPASSLGIIDIYEQAYGQHYGWQDLTNGGTGVEGLTRLTGNGAAFVRTNDNGEYSTLEWMIISQAAAHNQPMVASGTNTVVTDVNGTQVQVHGAHAYAVVGVGEDWVEVRNPWGHNQNNTYPYPSDTIRMSREEYERAFYRTAVGHV
ncbi:MAG: hypothetical protein LBR58_10000 [Propionibacteriaceae bacterium]|jgi:uncharacterized protein YukE|nr:hypothetical protein [Propionibacteriaceae bacterium]